MKYNDPLDQYRAASDSLSRFGAAALEASRIVREETAARSLYQQHVGASAVSRLFESSRISEELLRREREVQAVHRALDRDRTVGRELSQLEASRSNVDRYHASVAGSIAQQYLRQASALETAMREQQERRELVEMSRIQNDMSQQYLRQTSAVETAVREQEERRRLTEMSRIQTDMHQQYLRQASGVEAAMREQEERRRLVEMSRIPTDMRRWIDDLSRGQSFGRAAAIAQMWEGSAAEGVRQLDRFRNPLAHAPIQTLIDGVVSRVTVIEQQRLASQTASLLDAVSIEDVGAQAKAIVEVMARQQSLFDAIEALWSEIKDSKDSLRSKVLFMVLVPLVFLMLQAVINPIADHYIKRWMSESDQESNKNVRERAQQTVGDVRLLQDYRYVSAQVLTVRSSPRAKAPGVGNLRFGQSVRVMAVDGAFTQIEWSSSDGSAEVRGWVFSRYLKRFR